MKTIGISAWKGDAGKHLARRALHLIDKQGVDAWIWIVRRINDCTDKMLEWVAENSSVQIGLIVEGWEAPEDRLVRCSMVGDIAINAALMRGAERVLIHESDLISPDDLVPRLAAVLDAGERRAVAGGWPCLASAGMDESLDLYGGAMRLGRHMQIHVEGHKPTEPFFYDTWGYRHEGQRFGSVPPYSPCYRAGEPFCLDSVGSVALIDARYLQLGARMEHDGFVNLCGRIREQGGEIWCDPTITINQPLELWTFQDN